MILYTYTYQIIVCIYISIQSCFFAKNNKEHNKQNTYLIHDFVCPNVYPVSSPFSKFIAWQAAELKRPGQGAGRLMGIPPSPSKARRYHGQDRWFTVLYPP